MKWVARFKDRVGFPNPSVSSPPSREQLQSPVNGSPTRSRNKYESELDFKRFWEDFRSSNSEKEKEEALEMAVEVFCRLARQNGNPSQLVNTLVDARIFSFVVARALVSDIDKLKRSSAHGSLDAEEILQFFLESQKDNISIGANLLYALEGLVSPPLEVQPLLDAGLLSCLVYVMHSLLVSTSSDQGTVTCKEQEKDFQEGDLEQTHRLMVEGSIVHIMKALARHPGATQSLAEDDSLQLLFHVVAMGSRSHFSFSEHDIIARSPLNSSQLNRQAMQILGLLLDSDNGSAAQYIHKHQLLKALLKVVREFDSKNGDAAYAVGVVDLLFECIELSCRPEAGGVRLKDDLHNAHGYHFLVQLALKLADSHAHRNYPASSNWVGEESVVSLDNTDPSHTRMIYEGSVDDPQGSLPPVLTRLLDIFVNLAQVGVPENAGLAGVEKGGKVFGTKPTRFLPLYDGFGGNGERRLDGKVRDMDAVQVLQDVFLKAENLGLQLEVLDRLLRIFASYPENYGLCQELRTVSLFILNMATFPEVLQQRLLKILEYAVTVVNCVPEQELLSLCCLLQQPLAPRIRQSILSFFVKLLSFDQQYKKVFREVGVLEVLIDDVKHLEVSPTLDRQSAQSLEGVNGSSFKEDGKDGDQKSSSNAGPALTKARVFEDEGSLGIAWDCLVALLKNADGNQAVFRKANGVAAVLQLLTYSSHRAGILRLVSCLICEDTNQSHPEELGALIEVAKNGVVTNMSGRQLKVDNIAKRDVLWGIYRILGANSASRDVFGSVTGFSLLFTVLHSFQITQEGIEGGSPISGDEKSPQAKATLMLHMEVFDALLHAATMAVSGNLVNRGRLHKVISSQTFKDLLCESGLLCVDYENHVADLFMSLALEKIYSSPQISTESHQHAAPLQFDERKQTQEDDKAGFSIPETEEWSVILANGPAVELVLNAGAIEVLLTCLERFSPKLQVRVLEFVERLAQASAYNQDCLTAVGCIGLLLELVNPVVDTSSSLLTHVFRIVEVLGSYRLSSSELRTLARYVWQSRDSSGGETGQKLLDSMERMIHLECATFQNRSLAPFVELNMNRSGYSCISISLGDRSWPPAAGYSFACWLRYKNLVNRTSGEQQANELKNDSSKKRGSIAARQHAKIRIFSVGCAEEKSSLCAELYMDDSGVLTLATSISSYLSFKGVHLEEGVWHHLVIVHSKPNALAGLFQSSVAYLYLNGRLRHTGKLGYSASPSGKVLQATIGTPPSNAEVFPLSWQLGSCYLFEELLPAPAIFVMYAFGRGYRGLFQDTDLLRFMPYEACGGGNLATLEALEIDLVTGTGSQKGDGGIKASLNKTDNSGVVWDLDRLANFCNQISNKKLIFCFDGTRSESSTLSMTLSMINLVDPMSAAASPLGGLPRIARLHGDIHICSPCSLGENMRRIGGVAVVLALVEAAESREMLHLALSLLACILHFNPFNAYDMYASRGYHLLALFLHHRMPLFDMHDLDLLQQIAACEAAMVNPSVLPSPELENSIYAPGDSVTENSLENVSITRVGEEQASPFGSQIDAVDLSVQQEVLSRVSELDGTELPADTSISLVLANLEIMEHVLLDWTLWVKASISVQLALLSFLERLVSMHRYRNHNLTMLRRINIVQHLLVTLQRGDVEIPVLEKLVVLLGIILEDGFLPSELKYVVDFVVMTFDPPEVVQRSAIQHETMGMQVIVRNMLLEMLTDLQVTIASEEVVEEWLKIVSSKLIAFLLDEAVHPTSMQRVMTLLGVCLSSSPTFVSKFRVSGGYQGLVQVLPSFYDSPEIYYILFCLMFGKSVYPRQPEVRMLDFHALMPNDGGSGELLFTDLLEAVVAMSKAAFDRLTMQAQLAEQTGDQTHMNVSLAASLRGVLDSTEQLQGEALLHKTYAARLLGGEAAAPALVTSILRFMVDLAKMCQPFSAAFRRQDLLESCSDLYFSCARSAYAIQITQAASVEAQVLQNHVDLEDAVSSRITFSGSSDEQEQLKTLSAESNVSHPKVQEEKKSKVVDNVVSIPRSISGSKEIDGAAVSGTDEDSLLSEGIICDVNLFEMDSLDHVVALAAVSSPVVTVKRAEESATLLLPSPSKAGSESSSIPFFLVPGSPISSEVSHSGTGLRPLRSGLLKPAGSLPSWLGSSSQSEISAQQGAASLATPSTSMSELEPGLYYKTSAPGMLTASSFDDVKPELLLKLDGMGTGGGPCSAATAAVLDLIAEILADALTEQLKATSLVEIVTEASPLYINTDSAIVFQGLCLSRVMIFFERRLLRDDEEMEKKLDKSRWSSNLESFSGLLVDRVYMGAFSEPGAVLKVLEFIFSMLQLANKDRRVEEATQTGKGLLSLTRGGNRQVEPYVQALLKNANRMIMYCFTPPFLSTIGEDEFLSSSCPRTEVKRVDDGDGGSGSTAVDVCTVLQLMMANKRLVFCSINMDADLVCCLCINTISMLWDSRPSVRNLAVEVFKSLLIHRSTALEELLIVRPNQGEPLDVLHKGFDKLLSNNLVNFYQWLRNSKEFVSRVLEQCASIMWMQFVAGAAKFPGVRVKHTESRRKREMTRRIKESAKADIRHWEQMSERRYALDLVRVSMAKVLRVIRQDKYGWVLHAESEWEGHLQQLVHERSILPMLKPSAEGEPEWQLCATEGPYRMRKKLERCKLKVDMLAKAKPTLEDAEDERQSIEKNGLGLDITDPDYDSFFHLFSGGAASQERLSYNSKDFTESFEDKEYEFKDTEDDDHSSSAKAGWSDDQPSSQNDFSSQSAPDNATKGSSMRSAQTSVVGDTPASVCTSPKNYPQEVNEDLKYEDGKSERDFHDDGEYLIRPYLDPGEKIRFRYNCERVVGLEKHDGVFLIGELCLYVIENYYIDESGRISEKIGEDDLSVIDQALGMKHNNDGVAAFQELKQPGTWAETASVWPGGRAWAYSGGAWGKEKVCYSGHLPHIWRMWKLESVHELLKRPYQLRPVAIELFSMDGCNDLLVFHKNERDEVFKNLLAMNLPRNSMLDATISGASKQESNEGGRLFKMMAKSFSKRWQNGEISNFQYLMHLNTLAGRSYNDLTQYPVFPWVLADYESKHLDLSHPNSFRRLDKPMGALTPEREEEFRRRYESWDDPEIPRFHYGSHYSSAGIVLFYLIRLPPFSLENRKLQGGQFDHADRLFNSIRDTWLSASQGNTADVKELIPEFFYMPEFLENRFNLNFGVKQSGEKVDDVFLPPWAKGSMREFIVKHREALESQYVSENLHHWIDLIFGYKQRGKAAVEATNVFFHLTYEGAVDIDSIQDPAMKASILAQINHFGQTPRQLFLKAHPKRRCQQKIPPFHVLRHYNLLVPQEVRTVASPISQIVIFHDKIFITGSNRVLKPRSYNKYIAWGFPDRSLRFVSYDQDRLISTHEGLHGGGQVQCAGMSKDGRILVTGGDDGVVAIWRLRKDGVRKQRRLHLQRALCAHTQKVTCIAVCQPYSLVVSGSEDCSVIFWDLSSLEFVRQLPALPAAASAVQANDMTGEVVTAAGTNLAIWSINGDCLATVNTSQLPSDTIISVTCSYFSDWMETNWFITGHQSGSVKMWHMEHRPSEDLAMFRFRSQSVSSSSKLGLQDENILHSSQKDFRNVGDSSEKVSWAISTPEYQLILFRVLKWHKQPVSSVYLSNDLKQLLSGDAGGHLISWALPDETLKNPPLQEDQSYLSD